MKYIRVNWRQSNPDYPVVLYSEFDDDGWELRKVEVFSDGRCGFADQTEFSRDTRLGSEPLPSLGEIAADPQFEPMEIGLDAFEEVWAKRRIS